ncbi:MAG: HU family DNA-binding protein [Syntrophaceae bacterium]
MTKKELVKKVYERIEVYPSKDISYIVDLILEAMIGALKRSERIEIRDFGHFTVRRRKPIRGRNPKTSDIVHIPERRVPFFKVGKGLDDMINGRR